MDTLDNQKDTGMYNFSFSKERGVMTGDAYQAVKDKVDKDRYKLLLSIAAALGLMGISVYTSNQLEAKIKAALATIPTNKLNTMLASAGLSLASLYYALYNWDDKGKRNTALGVSALSGAYAARQSKLNIPPDTFTKGENAMMAVGTAASTAFPAVANYASGVANEIDKRRNMAYLLSSDLAEEDVARGVNAIKHQRSRYDKLPILKYVHLPIIGGISDNRNPSKASPDFDPEDRAIYFAAQRDKEHKRLIHDFERNAGRAPTDTEKESMLSAAEKKVLDKKKGVF